MIRFSAPSVHGATNITASMLECEGDFALRLKIAGEDAYDNETVTVWFRRYDRRRVEAYVAAINAANATTPAVVQVGDHPPERSPDTSKIVPIGDFDPVYQRKLDAVASEFGGDAA
jgi:hypothetical protein